MGATDDRDRRAYFSNYGECVDLFAPGVGIKSAWRGGGDNTISGTSMASPHGAGVVALALQRHTGASPDDITQIVVDNATEGVVDNPRDSPNLLLYARED